MPDSESRDEEYWDDMWEALKYVFGGLDEDSARDLLTRLGDEHIVKELIADDELFKAMIEDTKAIDEAYRYIDEAEGHARTILSAVAIDPDAVFEIGENGEVPLFITIDWDSLPTDISDAFEILHRVRHSIKPISDDPAMRKGVAAGVHLAIKMERLFANIAFRKPVESRRKSDAALQQYKDLGHTDEEIRQALEECSTVSEAAAKLGMSERQVYRRKAKLGSTLT